MNLEKTIGTKITFGLVGLALSMCAGCPPNSGYKPQTRRYEENSKVYDEQTNKKTKSDDDETLIFVPMGDGILIPIYF